MAPMAGPGEDLATQDKRVLSLPQLQSIMKKDPEAYVPEFEQQWSHFQSQMEIFKLKPQKPHPTFSEQVMFLAHVAPSFPSKAAALPNTIISALNEHDEIMHKEMRSTLVSALILLRNRNQFPCIQALPLHFKLFRLNDKSLRDVIFKHIVRDIVEMSRTTKSHKTHNELVDFFFGKLKEHDENVSRRACATFIALYRQNIWKDSRVINLMSAGLTHPDVKIAAALAHLFLGNKTKGLEGILEDSEDEEDDEEAAEINASMRIVGSKKTANRAKRVQRAKKAAVRVAKKKAKKEGMEGNVSFVAIDLLHDPQTLAERILHRLSKGSEPYLFRLLMLHLLARIVGRNSLQLLNLYPYLLKYLQPSQKHVTKILASLVEATHNQVSPDELRPVILHIMQIFVTEAQSPEVIEVGLNTIREVCSRAVNVLNEEELADLSEFKKFKNKGVSMAAKGLINVYRECHPELLHRSLRGREATMALSRGELLAPVFGNSQASGEIDGLDLLVQKKIRRKEREGDEDSDEGEEGGEKPPAGGTKEPVTAKQVMTEQILSTDDFQQMRKLRLQRSVELQLGRKRKAEDEPSSDSDSSDSETAGSDDEAGLQGRLPGAISSDQLKKSKKKAHNKQERVAMAKSDYDLKERIDTKRKQRKGGKNNAENARNKPLKMVTGGNQKIREKMNRKATEKVRGLKKHIKTLKIKSKHKHRR